GLTYPALFDPSWVATGAMVAPTRRYHGATVLADGRALVSGGKLGLATADTAELYDPATRTWAATGTMPNKSVNQTLTTLLTGKAANVGGFDGSGNPVAAVFLYDTAFGTWTTVAPMPNPGLVPLLSVSRVALWLEQSVGTARM
ncbi:MAG: kelch repeat-containing protein, partial [Gemmatimonadaceae bacterium]